MREYSYLSLNLLISIAAAFMSGFLSSCHETIHIHPYDVEEKVVLRLHVYNDPPQLGAIIDYTVEPAIVIYSDQVDERAMSKVSNPDKGLPEDLSTRAHALADALDILAGYDLDGENWELHLKYEVYAGTADDIRDGQFPIHSDELIYRADHLHPLHDVDMEIPFGNITVIAVAHLVPAGYDDDYFFLTSTLHTVISDMEKRQGEHDNVYRDCFVVGQEFYTEPTGIEGNVQVLEASLSRPQGRYIVVADDYEEYLRVANLPLEGAKSEIYYPGYINTSFSLLSNMPISSDYDFGYESELTLHDVKGSPYVRLGDDWSFVNGERSNLLIDISVKDRIDESRVSHNSGISVPIFPNLITLVVGHWLTEDAEGGGGVSVDPEFTDEIVIHF